MIRYRIRIHSDYYATIVDGVRLPWSRGLHAIYLPYLPYEATFTKGYLTRLLSSVADLPSPIFEWANFDLTHHIRRLVPTHSRLSTFKEWAVDPTKPGAVASYEQLIRRFPVDASVLRRFFPDMGDRLHPLVEEALVYAEFTDRMVQYRQVWLTHTQLSGLLFDHGWWRSRCQVMIGLGLIRVNSHAGVDVMGLGWAVDILDKAPPAIYKTVAGTPPSELGRAAVVEIDSRFSVAAFVNRRQVATSMAVPSKMLPFVPLAKVVATFAEAIIYVRGVIGEMKRTICFSKSGSISMDDIGWTTVVFTKPVGIYKGGDIVLVSRSCPSTTCVYQAGESRIEQTTLLVDSTKAISRQRLDLSYTIPSNISVDYIVVVTSPMVDPGIYMNIQLYSPAIPIFIEISTK